MNESNNCNQQQVETGFLVFMRNCVCLFVVLFSFPFATYSQNNIGINNATPDPSALLDLTSTTQGLLIPRMTTTERNLIPAPAPSLLVYDVTLQRYMFYNGVTWSSLLSNTTGWGTLGNTGLTAANFIGTTDAVSIKFRTSDTERMHIDPSGAVGVGVLATDFKAIFHIHSTTKGVILPRMSSLQRTTLIANGSVTDLTRDGMLVYDTNLKNFMSWNSSAFRWDTIMTRNNGAGLYWQLLGNTATNPAINYVGTTDSTDLVFRTNGIERFRIKANGLFYTANQGAGASNIYMGGLAGSVTSTGSNNAGFGLGSLQNNTTGSGNSALGSYALQNNTTGSENTGVGIESLRNNTTGYGNTSVGERSGFGNTTAYGNTSVGRYAIYNNQTGSENVGVGDSVLYGSTTNVGSSNVAVGNRVLRNNMGSRNVGLGYRALYSNISGFDNVGIGTDAMFNNSGGYYNVGIGRSALLSNVNGLRNVGIGYYAGYGIEDGDNNVANGALTMYNARNNNASNNVAIGYAAIYADTVPTSNVAIGYLSMYNGNQWDQNVGVGYYALRGSLTALNASRNVGIGYYAGLSMLSGYDNVFVGTQAGRSNTGGYNNVFIGTNAGYVNTNSAENVFIGTEAGYNNNTGSNNVFIGEEAGRANTSGSYNIYIGWRAGLDNTIGLGNTFVGWWSGNNNTSGQSNAIFGNLAGISNTTGSGNTYLGAAAGNAINTGTQNTFVGWVADGNANRSNAAAYGYAATATANNQVRIGNTLVTSIGGYAPWTNLSDGRFKKDVNANVPGLEFVMKLRPVTYHMDIKKLNSYLYGERDTLITDQESLKEKENMLQSGFIAQEVEEAAKQLNFEFSGVDKPKNEKDAYGLRYSEFVVPLVKAVQELNQKNTSLELQNNELKSELDLLKLRLQKLEQLLEKQ